ncbi:MAG: helix-turn-helix domain-containing protein [Actinomycetia bacterium]|nr:helix-turn-helix domain-containing protein [Actinomycetes bacterium]
MNVDIAERLASRRREAGYSQEALAERLGVTRQAVSKWERSESSPDTDNLIALAQLYNVSLDELLNVNPALADDMAFETADRARSHQGLGTANVAATSTAYANFGATTDGAADRPSDGPAATDQSSLPPADPTAATDDDSYVRINFRDGVHVKDAETGDEVHVGWSGIHIKDSNKAREWSRDWSELKEEQSDCPNCTDAEILAEEGRGGSGNVKSQYYAWYKFPFPIIAVIAYLLLGFLAPDLAMPAGLISPWLYGLWLIALIPLYYMILDAITHRGLIRFIMGAWPYACVVIFLWLGLMQGVWHPSWVIFLTIPIVEWLCEVIRRANRRAAANAAAPTIEINNKSDDQ